MSIRLFINGDEVKKLIAPEWADDLDAIADTFRFELNDKFEEGSKFTIYDDKAAVMKGIILTRSQSSEKRYSYTGFDFGFYLKQSSIIKQFNGIKISDAYQVLCSDFKIPVKTLPAFNATVKKIYKNRALSDVFKELLALVESKLGIDSYYLTCTKGYFEIKQYQYKKAESGLISKISEIVTGGKIQQFSQSVSMEELKNQVVIVDSSSDKVSKKTTLKDDESISEFGLLQHIEQVDTNKQNNYSEIAQKKLAELNQVKKTFNATIIGNHEYRKGAIIPVKLKDYDIDGNFLIKSSKHSFKDDKEFVDMVLEEYDIKKLA